LVLRGGVMRRATTWFFVTATDTNLATGSTAVLLGSLNAAGLALRPFTVVRTRGAFHVISDQISAGETYGASLGYSVVSDQAQAIGVTAVPTPATDQGSDMFFVYESVLGRFIFITGVGFETAGPSDTRYYDSKAMRKVEVGQDIVITTESEAFGSGAQVKHIARFLVKLH